MFVIDNPPLLGATKFIVSDEVDTLENEGAAGAEGIVTSSDGTTALEAVDAVEVPITFVAVTVNVYKVPFVRPVIKCDRDVDPAFESVPPPDTVYPVIADPPFDAGAKNVTVAFVLPAVAETDVGEPGADKILKVIEVVEVLFTTLRAIAVSVCEPLESPEVLYVVLYEFPFEVVISEPTVVPSILNVTPPIFCKLVPFQTYSRRL